MQQPVPGTPADAVWTLSDGHAGNRRQTQALCHALHIPGPRDIVLESSLPARAFAPRTWPMLHAPFGHAFHADAQTPPRLAIGCGRQAALATRLLRGPHTCVIQILDPRIDPRHWDAVIVPDHDRVRGDNVLTMLGSLHPVDDDWLASARAQHRDFRALPSPRIGMLIGGPSKHWTMDDASFDALLRDACASVKQIGGSLLAVASRRTPERWKAALHGIDANVPGVRWRDARDGDNPYAGVLACSDAIVCTPDSVNMLSEACATRVPVYVLDSNKLQGRPRQFVDTLLQRGRLHIWNGEYAANTAEPLRETARIATELRARFPQIAALTQPHR